LKHNCIKEVTLCEIDAKVIEVSKKFFPEISGEYNNNKANIII
jgi:spermidine synthase